MRKKPVNNVTLCGMVTQMEFSHESRGIAYYKAVLKIKEVDGRITNIPLRIRTDRVKGMDVENKQVRIDGCLLQRYVDSVGKTFVDVQKICRCDGENAINKISIVGEVSKEPERCTNFNGKPIVRFSLSKKHNGDFPVVASGRNTKLIENCLDKGTMIHLSGRLYSQGRKDDIALSINGRELSFLI